MKRTLGITALSLLVLAVLLIVSFGLTWAGIGWTGFFGPKQAAVQQNVWQNSSPHVQSVEQDLANGELQLSRTKDPQQRKGIIDVLRTESAGMDPNTVGDPSLRKFMEDIQSGNIQ